MLKGSEVIHSPKYKYDVIRFKKTLRRFKRFMKGNYVDILGYGDISGKKVYNLIHKSLLRYGPYIEKGTWLEKTLNANSIFIPREHDKNGMPIEFDNKMRENVFAGLKYRRRKQRKKRKHYI